MKHTNTAWNIEDINGFKQLCSSHIGQLKSSEDRGKCLYDLSKDPDNKISFDIGTWNGLGSTRIFIEGIDSNPNKKECKLFTFETNHDKYQFAKTYWNEDKLNGVNVEFINKRLIEHYNDEYEPCKDRPTAFIEVDKINHYNSELFSDKDIPHTIDVICIDGGQRVGEFIKFAPITKHIILDDYEKNHKFLIDKYIHNTLPHLEKVIEETDPTKHPWAYFRNNTLIKETKI